LLLLPFFCEPSSTARDLRVAQHRRRRAGDLVRIDRVRLVVQVHGTLTCTSSLARASYCTIEGRSCNLSVRLRTERNTAADCSTLQYQPQLLPGSTAAESSGAHHRHVLSLSLSLNVERIFAWSLIYLLVRPNSCTVASSALSGSHGTTGTDRGLPIHHRSSTIHTSRENSQQLRTVLARLILWSTSLGFLRSFLLLLFWRRARRFTRIPFRILLSGSPLSNHNTTILVARQSTAPRAWSLNVSPVDSTLFVVVAPPRSVIDILRPAPNSAPAYYVQLNRKGRLVMAKMKRPVLAALAAMCFLAVGGWIINSKNTGLYDLTSSPSSGGGQSSLKENLPLLVNFPKETTITISDATFGAGDQGNNLPSQLCPKLLKADAPPKKDRLLVIQPCDNSFGNMLARIYMARLAAEAAGMAFSFRCYPGKTNNGTHALTRFEMDAGPSDRNKFLTIQDLCSKWEGFSLKYAHLIPSPVGLNLMESTIAEDLQHLALRSAQRDEMPDALNEDVVIHFRCGGTSCFLTGLVCIMFRNSH